MGKRRPEFDEKTIATRIRKGYGSGEGKNYKPWLNIQDVPSSGRVSRSFGWKTGREHHFMSDQEKRYFYVLEWSDSVIDIREQFPLLDREHAIKIAEANNIKYPVYIKTRNPYVLTTDFMITTISNGKKHYIARTIKPPDHLNKPGVIKNFEIEKIYWEERGIDWGIVEETEECKSLSKNIDWVHAYYWINDLPIKDGEILDKMLNILKERMRSGNETVLHILTMLDREYNLEKGTCLALMRHLIARKQIKIGMTGNMDFKKIKTDMISVVGGDSAKEMLA